MTDLAEAIDAAINPPPGSFAALEAEQKRLEAAARGWTPDPRLEADLAARAADPERWDRLAGGTDFELAVYADARRAAVELGTYHPEESR